MTIEDDRGAPVRARREPGICVRPPPRVATTAARPPARPVAAGLFALALAACAWGVPGPLQAADPNAFRPRQVRADVQPETIRARHFPEPRTAIGTPAFATPDRYTTQNELLEFVGRLGHAPGVFLLEAGRSQAGETIPLVVFTRSADGRPETLRESGRPTVWIQAQQHGNEPASGEAALALAAELAHDDGGLLDALNVVIVPRANPDGARHDDRRTANGRDLNRDSMRLMLAESRQLRRLNLAYAPVLTIDAHEYRPARVPLNRLGDGGLLEAHDLLILGPENLNVHPLVRRLTSELLIGQTKDDVRTAGLSIHDYYTVAPGLSGMRPHLQLGGTEARIGRNYHGLVNQASILLESRGIGLGRLSYGRRVFSLVTAMRSLLHTTARFGPQIQATLAEVGRDIVARGARMGDDDPVAVGVREGQPRSLEHPFVDLASGDIQPVAVRFTGREERLPRQVRERPLAYVLEPDQTEAARTLLDLGLTVHRLAEPAHLAVQAMQVVGYREEPVPYEGVHRRRVATQADPRLMAFPPGSFIVPMDQPLANLAIEALEPEGEDSFVCFGIVDARRDTGTLPVYRVIEDGFRQAGRGEPMPREVVHPAPPSWRIQKVAGGPA